MNREKEETRFDRLIKAIKNHKTISFIIVVGVVIIALATFLDALNKISELIQQMLKNEEDLKISQFTVDESKSSYRLIDLSINNVSVGTELSEIKDELEERGITLVIEKKEGDQRPSGEDDCYDFPYLIMTIQNDSDRQVVFNNISFIVYEVSDVLGAGKSEVLEPLGTYSIEISPKPGTYRKRLNRPLKVAKDDSATIGIRILPIKEFPIDYDIESMPNIILQSLMLSKGKLITGELRLHWANGYLNSPKFLLYLEF